MLIATHYQKASLGLALLTSAFAHGQAKYDVYVRNQVVGQGKFYLKKLPDGGVENYLSMYFTTNEGKSEFAARGIYNRNGRPVRENYVQKSPAGKKTTMVTYSAGSVKAEVHTDNRRTNKTVKLPEGSNLNSASVLWFVRKRPVAGAQDRGYEFNSDLLRFEERMVVYLGTEPLIYGGRKVVSHKISNGQKTFWLDDQGLPLKIDLGMLQLIRKN